MSSWFLLDILKQMLQNFPNILSKCHVNTWYWSCQYLVLMKYIFLCTLFSSIYCDQQWLIISMVEYIFIDSFYYLIYLFILLAFKIVSKMSKCLTVVWRVMNKYQYVYCHEVVENCLNQLLQNQCQLQEMVSMKRTLLEFLLHGTYVPKKEPGHEHATSIP